MPSQLDITRQTPVQPRQIRLDTTTRCNARCLSCHRYLSERKGEMPADLILKILHDVKQWEKPLEEIVPVNYGEFLLRRDWLWILQIINDLLPYTIIVLPTNGSLIKNDAIGGLCSIPALRIINFSINALYDETYESFMGLPANIMRQIEETINEIKKRRSDMVIVTSFVFDPMYQTDEERDNFYYFWKDKAIPQIIAAASARRPEKKPCNPVLIPCRSIFSDIVVGYDGKLSSCCFDPAFSLSLNYYSGDLLKDWHNSQLEELRRLHNEHQREEIGICKDCTFA